MYKTYLSEVFWKDEMYMANKTYRPHTPYVECSLQGRYHTDEPAGVSGSHIKVLRSCFMGEMHGDVKGLAQGCKVMLFHVCPIQWGQWRLREWPSGYMLSQEAHDCVLSSVS